MTEDDVLAAAERLDEILERFAPSFGKAEAQRHALNYIKGLLVCPGRKSIEPIAVTVGEGRVSGLQKFINIAPWQYDDIQAEIQAVFDERLAVASTGETVGTVGVIEECGFLKKGRSSVGVERQVDARSGRVANCQVGLFLVGVVPDGSAMLDHHLFLPSSWCDETEEGRGRRARVHVPEDLRFRTRAQVAADLVRGVVVLGQVRLDWVVSREPYATSDEFLDELERLEQRYLMEVPGTTVVAGPDTPAIGPPTWPALLNHAPATRWSVAAVYERWPDVWFRSGSSDWAVVRVRPERLLGPGGPAWLLMRRAPGPTAPPRFYLSNSGPETPPELLPRVLEAQGRASGYLDEARRFLGQGHYETRSWVGWHHHMSLVALAHLVVTLSRSRKEADPGPESAPG